MTDYVEIGRKIRAARESAGKSQLQLAEEVGLGSGTAISLLESGARKVSIAQLKRIAEALGLDQSHFLGEPNVNVKTVLRAEGLTSNDVNTLESIIKAMKSADGSNRSSNK